MVRPVRVAKAINDSSWENSSEVELLTVNQVAVGSNPAFPSKNINYD